MKHLLKYLLIFFGFAPAVYAQPLDIDTIQKKIYIDEVESWADIVGNHEKSNSKDTLTIQCKLDDCILRALEHSPSISETLNQIKSQEKALLASTRAWLPTLSISANPLFGSYWNTSITEPLIHNYFSEGKKAIAANPDHADFIEDGVTPSYTFTNSGYKDISGSIKWTFLDIPRSYTIQENKQRVNQYKYLHNIAARDLAYRVSLVHSQLIADKITLGKYNDIINASENALKTFNQQYKIGFITLADLSKSKNQNLNILSTYLAIATRFQKNSAYLASLLGHEESFVTPLETEIQITDWEKPLNETLQLAKNNNERFHSLMAEASSLLKKSKALSLNILPSFYAFVNGSYQEQNGFVDTPLTPKYRSFYMEDSYEWSASAGLGFNLVIDGGRSLAEASSIKYRALAVQDQAADDQLNTTSIIKAAFEGLSNNLLRIKIANEAVKQAENANLVFETVSKLGVINVTQRVQAISLYSQSVIELAKASLDAKNAELLLYRYTYTLPENSPVREKLYSFMEL